MSGWDVVSTGAVGLVAFVGVIALFEGVAWTTEAYEGGARVVDLGASSVFVKSTFVVSSVVSSGAEEDGVSELLFGAVAGLSVRSSIFLVLSLSPVFVLPTGRYFGLFVLGFVSRCVATVAGSEFDILDWGGFFVSRSPSSSSSCLGPRCWNQPTVRQSFPVGQLTLTMRTVGDI